MQISNPCVGKQYFRCMAACRIRCFYHCLHIRMHFHPHLFLFIHSHARYLACSQKSLPFANGIQFANRTKCSRTGHSCSRTGSVRGWDGTYTKEGKAFGTYGVKWGRAGLENTTVRDLLADETFMEPVVEFLESTKAGEAKDGVVRRDVVAG